MTLRTVLAGRLFPAAICVQRDPNARAENGPAKQDSDTKGSSGDGFRKTQIDKKKTLQGSDTHELAA
jgi:hypothetical protein